MSEWHLAPDYILDNWTEELFALMFQKRAEQLAAMNKATGAPAPVKHITDHELFQMPGCGYNYVKVN